MATLLHAALAVLAVALVAVSALPYWDSDLWFVRMADFPRLQLLVLLLAVGAALAVFVRRRPLLTAALLAAVAAAALGHAAALWPYRPGGENVAATCPPERRLAVMVANVRLGNRTAEPLLEMVAREEPDLFLAMETDGWWDEALAPLSASMPHRAQEITGSFFGIHLFSRLPLVDPEIRYLAGQDTPAVLAGVALPSGETIDLLGVHPRPPHPVQSSTPRDAQLYAAALLARDGERAAVVAGDFNATPWESTVERMRRVGGLIAPRQGYGYVATYDAGSWWRRWPLDLVFHEAGFATLSLERLDAFGSDHHPFVAHLCRIDGAGEVPPPLREGDLETAREAIAAATGDG